MQYKASDLNYLEENYGASGNQLLLLYGGRGCCKEELIRKFTEDKKHFYYRCRNASPLLQQKYFEQEMVERFDLKPQKHTYDEYFNHMKSGDSSKLVLVIDQADLVLKKDPVFRESLIKLRRKKLYPGPVMVILCTEAMTFASQEFDQLFGEDARFIDAHYKLQDFNFLEVVRYYPELSVADAIRIYGVLGGVPAYLKLWDPKLSFKKNICNLMLTPEGPLFREAQDRIGGELRELAVYNTILESLAAGRNKLNDLYHETGYSRAKLSVYMKNLSHFDIVEKLVSFETGGWENAKKGVYQIKNTLVNFYFKFVYPHESRLYELSPEEFYDRFIARDLNLYLHRYFRNVCQEYLGLLNQMGQLPFPVTKMGTWVGKTGSIDIIAQSSDRRNIIGFCNWDAPLLTMQMCEDMARAMEAARLTSDHYYLFSATDFELALKEYVTKDPRFVLIDMKEL